MKGAGEPNGTSIRARTASELYMNMSSDPHKTETNFDHLSLNKLPVNDIYDIYDITNRQALFTATHTPFILEV